MNLKKEIKLQTIIYSLLVSIMIITLLSILLSLNLTQNSLGMELLSINKIETSSANAVTSVVTYFRGVDTLGEVTILFLAIFGVSLGVENLNKKRNIFNCDNELLQIATKVITPLIVLLGVYIIIHGHLSPGGGFQGGVIIASAFLLKFLAYGDNISINHKVITILESFSGAGFILVGVLAMLLVDRFFANFLPLGDINELFSAGLIPIIYIFVGIKVSAEITALLEYFIKVKNV